MTLTVELERAASSGEWIAEIPELPGCMAVEATEHEALARMGKLTGLRPEDQSSAATPGAPLWPPEIRRIRPPSLGSPLSTIPALVALDRSFRELPSLPELATLRRRPRPRAGAPTSRTSPLLTPDARSFTTYPP